MLLPISIITRTRDTLFRFDTSCIRQILSSFKKNLDIIFKSIFKNVIENFPSGVDTPFTCVTFYRIYRLVKVHVKRNNLSEKGRVLDL